MAAMSTMVVPFVIRRRVRRTVVIRVIIVPAVISGSVVIVNGLTLIIPGRAVATPIITRSDRHLETKVLSA
jgi:hypothetical protein